MTDQMTPANDPSVDESPSTEENATPAGTVYNGEFRPDPNRPEQSEEDLALRRAQQFFGVEGALT